ncbi:MAG TPA: hypothetical protein DCZ10_07785 [Pelotomaculum sp.]|nr:hypothetical protein [Pelotomaculum sp.]
MLSNFKNKKPKNIFILLCVNRQSLNVSGIMCQDFIFSTLERRLLHQIPNQASDDIPFFGKDAESKKA